MKDLRIGVVGVAGGWSTERLVACVKEATGSACLIEMNEVCVNLAAGTVHYRDITLNDLDALIVKKVGQYYSPNLLDRMEMLRFLADQGVRIYSRPEATMRALDRLSCTVSLRKGGIPMPPTFVTESRTKAVENINMFGRAVLKPLYTTKARGMVTISSDEDVAARVAQYQEAGHRVLYIQKLLDLPGQDLGLVFMGGEYIGTYARVGNDSSWNTTIHSGGRYNAYKPSSELIRLAQKAQDLFGLDFTCVDVAETSEGPVVFEVSAFGGFRGLHAANGTDAARRYVDYVIRDIGNG